MHLFGEVAHPTTQENRDSALSLIGVKSSHPSQPWQSPVYLRRVVEHENPVTLCRDAERSRSIVWAAVEPASSHWAYRIALEITKSGCFM
ncbi:hypothetical protein N7539_005158 [Penicillium diatomitis]|uniref:Uncharacterized protein n=1 Tax=Penicillium diatomitis TaxID=2819901 RepID=A0A9W9X7L4_9EURO|nr:uncharacterized protein N7539_005158 [Penicillium diatomitis]KAJ5485170.1 hypothetical protein N7539_005158 [Penicillium diatomitis]